FTSSERKFQKAAGLRLIHGRDRSVLGYSELSRKERLIRAAINVPDACRRPVYSDVVLAVAVVIANDRLIFRNAPLDNRHAAVRASQNIPKPVRRPVDRDVGRKIAVEIAIGRQVSA